MRWLAVVLIVMTGTTGAAFAPAHEPSRAGEVLRSCLDVTLARAELGLPEPTPLTDGLRATLDWVRTVS